jgi:hypothetical protein
MNQETHDYRQDDGKRYGEFEDGFVWSEQRHPGNESDNEQHRYQEFHFVKKDDSNKRCPCNVQQGRRPGNACEVL